jgi:beta-glucosidase
MNYYSGVEGGNALANILCGKVNPGGKLPFTIAKDETDYPAIIGIGQKPYEIEYGYYHGYTLFDKKGLQPAYPFGFGLSYTAFSIDNLKAIDEGDSVKVSVDITNTGSMDGAEVVQVYAGSNDADLDRPVKLLKGYQRVDLSAGETKTVSILINKVDLRFYNPDTTQWILDKSYTIYVGNSSLEAMKQQTRVFF